MDKSNKLNELTEQLKENIKQVRTNNKKFHETFSQLKVIEPEYTTKKEVMEVMDYYNDIPELKKIKNIELFELKKKYTSLKSKYDALNDESVNLGKEQMALNQSIRNMLPEKEAIEVINSTMEL